MELQAVVSCLMRVLGTELPEGQCIFFTAEPSFFLLDFTVDTNNDGDMLRTRRGYQILWDKKTLSMIPAMILKACGDMPGQTSLACPGTSLISLGYLTLILGSFLSPTLDGPMSGSTCLGHQFTSNTTRQPGPVVRYLCLRS